jgi:hypothetical protein
MKIKLMLACVVLLTTAMSCKSTEEGDVTTTNNADTAVLVEDPANKLEANPVKDTVVKDTVHSE